MERLCEREFKSIVAGRKAGERLAFIEKEIWDMDLSGMDLSGMDFTLSSFQNTVLNGVDFEGSSVENALFDGCGLRGANFRNAEMKTASFRYCDMRECNIEGANLFGAVLEFANLEGIVSNEDTRWFRLHCPEEGAFLGYKKCVNDRMVLCNLAVEAGAKTAIFEADEIALEYLKARGRKPKAVFSSDPDAVYVREYTFDLSAIVPVAARPDFVDDVVPAKEVCGVRIDEAFLGSCNNGRIDELRVGASVLKGRRVADHVRFLVVPASQEVYLEAMEEGLIRIFMESGAIVMNPNCSVCWGSCQGVIGEGEVLISTGTRNFKGRAGHPSSKVYLGSAATVAASAVKGEICTADML